MKNSGFTLIELLIVVAIIAILAAIAIPNFLQAQVRSKVSRVQADMRSVATALESYYVDHNEYIPDYRAWWENDERYARYLQRFIHLTTPVAYMTSIPEDAFAEGPATERGNPFRAPYTVDYTDDGELDPILAFDFAQHHRDSDYTNTGAFMRVARAVGAQTEEQERGIANQMHWILRSVGPDGMSRVLGDPEAVQYDPTNGTISAGQIYRSNMRQH